MTRILVRFIQRAVKFWGEAFGAEKYYPYERVRKRKQKLLSPFIRPLYAKKNIKEGRKFAIFSLILFQHHFFRHYYYHFIGPADICRYEYSNLSLRITLLYVLLWEPIRYRVNYVKVTGLIVRTMYIERRQNFFYP